MIIDLLQQSVETDLRFPTWTSMEFDSPAIYFLGYANTNIDTVNTAQTLIINCNCTNNSDDCQWDVTSEFES